MDQSRSELQLPTGFDASLRSLIEEMIAYGRFEAIIWAGGYASHVPHCHSDIDLYAVAGAELPHHWTMERIGGRRVELTAYTQNLWQEILSAPYRHAKHHFTFANGQVLFDPNSIIPELQTLATHILGSWPKASQDALEEMRNGVAIQRDKICGFREKRMELHLRMYSQGFALLACGLLATSMYGHSVDAGKNLTRLLNDPDCPTDVKELFAELLGGNDNDAMADAALNLADRCLELTGGPVDLHNGGIPR